MAIPEDGEGRVMMNDDVLACVLCVVWKVSGLFFLTLSEKLEPIYTCTILFGSANSRIVSRVVRSERIRERCLSRKALCT